MKVEIVRGEVKTERIDRSTETPEKEQFEKYIQLYRNVLVNVSVSIKTIEELTDRKREKELNLFFEYCPAFINAVFNNFWAQSVIGLHEFFRGRDYGIEKFIDYAKSNWKKIFTGKWKRTTTWSDGKIEEEIISHKYSEIEERLNRVEQILETNKEVIEKIKSINIDVVMLTGDNEKTANYVAKSINITNVIAGVKPKEKAEHIKELKEKGRTETSSWVGRLVFGLEGQR